MFQSRRDPGMALRRKKNERIRINDDMFQSRRDPGMALRHKKQAVRNELSPKFQSRRDPGMALRLGRHHEHVVESADVSIPS